jgi:hypothetical protein
MFNPRSTEEESMKKFGYIIAALGTLAIAAPSIASAEDIVIKSGDGDRGGRAEFREHRGEAREHRGEFREHRGEFRERRAEFREHREFRRHGHGDKVMIIKHRRHDY